MSDEARFSFHEAFDRNIGWMTDWEQLALRGKRIAIAGMGGVGGFHLLTLARLGIGAFNIADLDTFEIANFNRQIGATIETVGRPKAETLAEMALAINPEIRIKRFDTGIDESNIDAFLDGVDLFVDGFDFFVLGIRRKVFARCAELGIPAVTAAPIGMGVGFLAFVPGGMSFEEYFCFEGHKELRQYVHFLLGTGPAGLHRKYLVDPSRLDFGNRRAPSTVAGCELCAAVTAVAAVKLLLGRGEMKPAPYHHHFDAYRGKLVVTKLPRGNASPLQSLKARLATRAFEKMLARTAGAPARRYPATPVEEILNLARWAPSGDNAQHWRFRLVGQDEIAIGVHPEPGNVYEYRDAEPVLLGAGMLIETLRIAASGFGRRITWHYEGAENGEHRISVKLIPDATIDTDPLFGFITLRSVDRRPYRTTPLTTRELQALQQAVGPSLIVEWRHDRAERLKLAKLGAAATNIRLRAPEAFKVHQKIIDWNRKLSPTGIPATALGMHPSSLGAMRWSMRSWARSQLFNRLGSTKAAGLQMDLLPGLNSAAYFTMRPAAPIEAGNRNLGTIEIGAAIQRFWLTATKLGLAMQPALATLIFADYGAKGAEFTREAELRPLAAQLAEQFRQVLGRSPSEYVFMGRIGRPRPRKQLSRSTRRSLDELVEAGTAADPAAIEAKAA